MKLKIFTILLFAIFLAGCGEPRTPELYSRSTTPIFITNGDVNKTSRSVYVYFKNSSGYASTLENTVRNKLLQNGFTQSVDQKNADVVIMGDFASLQRLEQRERPRVYMNMGYGWGSYGYRHSLGVGMLFGDPFDDDFYDRTDYYLYRAFISVMIRANGSEQRTNLEIESGRNLYSPSYIIPYIEEKAATQILGFFYP
ncbi:complement resistance protein TraT [Campylobacter rectus]|uniref:complement resistance protein TraT n=1 Tax=Campylobacter rectus TaxID=203 RepID=UPI0023F03E80|nr:complement resistance protein TraT [Campylobacter rectus]